MAIKNEFHRDPNEIRSILIYLTEEEHRKLRLIKAIFDKTWKELFVDFYIDLMETLMKNGEQAMMQKIKAELQKAINKKKQKEGKCSQ